MKTVVRIYSPERNLYEGREGYKVIHTGEQKGYTITVILFIILNMALGLCSQPILELIGKGLDMFA